MPEFVLRYKVPELDWGEEVDNYVCQAYEIAGRVQAKASEIFFGWNVVYEVRPFEGSDGQPNIAVTGWITDNEDKFVEVTLRAQSEILTLIQELTFENQTVECWWQRVKGKWGGATGLKKRN